MPNRTYYHKFFYKSSNYGGSLLINTVYCHRFTNNVPKPAKNVKLPKTRNTIFTNSCSVLKPNVYAKKPKTNVNALNVVSGNLLKVFTITNIANAMTRAGKKYSTKSMKNSPPK